MSTYSLTLWRADAYQQRKRALRRTADLEQLRAFPLATPATNKYYSWFALFNALFSVIYVANLSALIWLSHVHKNRQIVASPTCYTQKWIDKIH